MRTPITLLTSCALAMPLASVQQVPDLSAWNMQFAVPSGWQVSRTVGRLQVLGSNTEAGAIFVAPGLYADFNQVGLDVSQFFSAMGMTAQIVEQRQTLTVNGMQAMAATYGSSDQMGQVVLTRGVAVISPHGTGLIVMGMTTQQQMPQLRRRVDQLAQSLRVHGPPQANQQMVQALAGRWMYYDGNAGGGSRVSGSASRSHEEFVQFDGRGQFAYQMSSAVNVSTPGYTGSAGGASSSSDQGSYTVIGTTLVLRGRQGQLTFEVQLLGDRLIADGRTYLRTN